MIRKDRNRSQEDGMTQVRFVRRGVLLGLWILLSLLLVFSGISCGVQERWDYGAYRASGFSAEVQGSLRGEEIAARIEYDATGGGRVDFLSPAALCGLSLRLFPDGRAELAEESLSIALPATSLAGLLEPLSFFLPEGSPRTVEKIPASAAAILLAVEDGRRVLSLSYGEGYYLYLDGETRRPLGVVTPEARLSVVWWEG